MANDFKILLTGGHAHATAYALIKELKELESNIELFWIGPKSLMEGKKVEGIENKVFQSLGVKVSNVNAGRVQTKLTRFTIPSILKVPLGFLQSLILVARIRPDVTVSFGGFVGLPVVIASWVMRIPVIIHEQTTAAGRGNIYASIFAKKIVLSRMSSVRYFPGTKTILIGNPIDKSILSIKRNTKLNTKPTIFVTGGHTGSSRLNSVLLSALPGLLDKFYVVHQTGKVDFEKCVYAKSVLGNLLAKNYEIYANIDPTDWPKTLQKADIVVSRAGANTVSQLVALKIPSLLIPIPHSYLNEQSKNADYAVDFGISRKLKQDELNAAILIREINYLVKNWVKIVASVSNKKSPDLLAAKNFAKLILNEAKKKS